MTIMELAAEISSRLEQGDLDECYRLECEIMRSVPQNEGEEAILLGECESLLDSIVHNDYAGRVATAGEIREAIGKIIERKAVRTGIRPDEVLGEWWGKERKAVKRLRFVQGIKRPRKKVA